MNLQGIAVSITVAPTPWGIGGTPPLLQTLGTGGHREQKNSKTDQTVLTITKVLAKTTNCRPIFGAKKVEGHDQKIPELGAGPVPPCTFKFFSAPLVPNPMLY